MIKKKIKLIAFIGILSFLFGCSGGTTPVESEPQGNSDGTIEEAVKEETLNIKDNDSLYEYFNGSVFEMSKEDFDSYMEISYLDITGDGNDEAILINNMQWDQPIEIVTVEDNLYYVVSDTIAMAKYMNEFSLKDGFLVLKQKTGGTGMADTYLSLFKYDGSQLIKVLEYVYLEGHVSVPPNVAENYISTIDGNYDDFEYLLVKEDNINNTRKVMESKHYSYNEENFSFSIVDTEAPEIKETIEEEVEEDTISFKPGTFLEGYGKITYGLEEIDMNKCIAVALPMYNGKYNDKLEIVEYNIGSTNDKRITISMFGNYENVELEYYLDNDADGVITKIGDLSNKILVINGDFNNPQSYVRVKCDVNGSDDRWSSSFNMDPTTNAESNMHLIIE